MGTGAIYFFLVGLIVLIYVSEATSNLYSDPRAHYSEPPKHVCDDGACDANDGPLMIGRKQGLTRLDGVKVGHTQEVDLGDDGRRTLITRAMRPLLFEIPDFLSSEECDHIISLANQIGMFSSMARGGLTKLETWEFTSDLKGKASGPRGEYKSWDQNMDGKITVPEIVKFAQIQRYLYLEEDEIRQIFTRLNMTELNDDVITREEFDSMNSMLLDGFLYELTRRHPKHRQRFSDQQWLNQKDSDTVLARLLERVRALTKLSKEIIYGSEYLQVVHYNVGGHYHTHYDTETHTQPEVTCCHQTYVSDPGKLHSGKCKLCRYITILYFLNDVEEGGETAFPFADNGTLNANHIVMNRAEGRDLHNLNEFCHEANLVVQPRKGTAIMWYNHLLDPRTDWMGDRDEFSLHGGCAVKKGHKWIANNWITAPYPHGAHVKSVYLPWAINQVGEEIEDIG
ncbi:transmembrane prolyl 4-hydroxylase [Nematostella vectensis]|uniref:transmembrane prolyl 4-hydroxylase n=1 Tax=Nematostella vectensis TaxID=45351 RepID=UPI002076DE35|nr:transmembrane prolyl 4-hydroxylase [Nematostella vectensis]